MESRALEAIQSVGEFANTNPSQIFWIICSIIFICFVLVVFVSYGSASTCSAVTLLVFAFPALNYLWGFPQKYKLFLKNREVINSPDNLSIYKDKDKQKNLLAPNLRKHFIFKKCNFAINTYYWKVMTRDSEYFYTSLADEQKTLEKIKGTIKFAELKRKMVDDFFEYCLVSYLCNESESHLRTLSSGKEATYDGLTIRTQGSYEVEKRQEDTKTPDLTVEIDDQLFVFDAYNGTSTSHIKSKLTKYANFGKKTSIAYVCSSEINSADQLALAVNQSPFRFWTLKDNVAVQVEKIQVGERVLSSGELNQKYFEEYSRFYSEVYYWLSCIQSNKIVQSASGRS